MNYYVVVEFINAGTHFFSRETVLNVFDTDLFHDLLEFFQTGTIQFNADLLNGFSLYPASLLLCLYMFFAKLPLGVRSINR